MNTTKIVQFIRRTILGVAFCILTFSSVHAETINCTAITSIPYIISTQGVYCFTGNLGTSITSGSAISINTNNVTIDMNGYKLGGLGAGAGTLTTGIYALQRKNITIRNGTIRGFYRGIYFSDLSPYITSQGHLIEDIRADQNRNTGMQILGKGNILRRNQVVDTGGASATNNYAYAFNVVGPGARLLDNDVIGATASGSRDAFGIRLADANDSVIKGNRIDDISSSNGAIGIFIFGSTGVLVRANSITNAPSGIVFFNPSTEGKYMDNLTSNVTTPFGGGTAVGTND